MKEKIIPFPDKQYNVIYADPPWYYGRGEYKKKTSRHGPRFISLNQRAYQMQSDEWIKQLPVSSIAAKDCALFLWTTDAHLLVAIEVIKAWGFKYSTVAFVWEKLGAHFGVWTVKHYEICLLGMRGNMLKYKRNNVVPQKIVEKKRAHSQKPDKARIYIEALFGDIPRIELFARCRIEGWDVWGDEVDERRIIKGRKKGKRLFDI